MGDSIRGAPCDNGVGLPGTSLRHAGRWGRMTFAWTLRTRLLGVAAVTAAYSLMFPHLCRWLGPTVAALGIIPVICAAVAFGRRGGMALALLMVPLNTGLLNLSGLTGWDVVPRSGGAPSIVAFLATGLAVGWLRKLLGQLRVTEASHRQAEAALRQSAGEFRTLVEQLPATIYRAPLDESGATLFISPQALPMLGYDPERWLDDADFWPDRVHPDDRARVLEAFASGRATGQPVLVDYRFRARGGREVWLRDEAMLVRDERGQILYWQGVLLDITERNDAPSSLSSWMETSAPSPTASTARASRSSVSNRGASWAIRSRIVA
jgi:PAS domain S-box-containing protein